MGQGNEANNEPTTAIEEDIRTMFRNGEYAEAVGVIQAHVVMEPEDVAAFELMATALKFSGDKAGAAGALLTAAELYGQRGMSIQAISAQKKASAFGVEPDYAVARPGQGDEFLADMDMEEAEEFDMGAGLDLGVGDDAAAEAVPAASPGRLPTPLFDALQDDEFVEVAQGLQAREFEPGALIVEEEKEGDSMFVIASGQVEVFTTQGGSDVPLATLGAGDFFGESSLLSGRPRTATIKASTGTECLELSSDALDAITAKFPRVKEVMQEFNLSRANATIEALLGKAQG